LLTCAADNKTACQSDPDCVAANKGATCQADRSKIRRDVKRLADLRLMGDALERVNVSTGAYPSIAGGSFIAGRSTSFGRLGPAPLPKRLAATRRLIR